MALKSREQPPQFGGPERQAVTNEIHEAMLAAEAALVLSDPKIDHITLSLPTYRTSDPSLAMEQLRGRAVKPGL